MTQKQHRAGLALAGAVVGAALLLLLVGLVARSSDRVGVDVPIVLGGAIAVGAVLAMAWRAVTSRAGAARTGSSR